MLWYRVHETNELTNRLKILTSSTLRLHEIAKLRRKIAELWATKSEMAIADCIGRYVAAHPLIWSENDRTNIHIEVGKEIPEKAEDLRRKDECGNNNNRWIPIKIEMPNQDNEPYPPDSTGDDSEFKNRSNLLIPAFAAAITLFEAFHLPGVGNYLDSTIFSMLVLINTIVFFISMASITMVMRRLPIIPWLIISVSCTIGLYICAIFANSPGEIVPVLFIGGFIFLAVFFQFLPTFHLM